MGDSSVEVSEENMDAAQEAKGKAMGALSEGIYFVNLLCCVCEFGCLSVFSDVFVRLGEWIRCCVKGKFIIVEL